MIFCVELKADIDDAASGQCQLTISFLLA